MVTGLYNQGSTCFLNALLQLLFRATVFMRAVCDHSVIHGLEEHVWARFHSFFDSFERFVALDAPTACLACALALAFNDNARARAKSASKPSALADLLHSTRRDCACSQI